MNNTSGLQLVDWSCLILCNIPSTALRELEELSVDRTVITNEGCTVLPSKYVWQQVSLNQVKESSVYLA